MVSGRDLTVKLGDGCPKFSTDVEIRAMNCLFPIRRPLDEAKPSRLSRLEIDHHLGGLDGPELRPKVH
jgi:hypothetical protein